MLCGQKESLVVDSGMKALVETIDEGLKVLGKKRISAIEDGHCLMWAWAKGFHIPKILWKQHHRKSYCHTDVIMHISFREAP